MRSSVRTGQATVELALVLPLFLLLVFAIVDFGRTFHVWLCINLQCVEAAFEGSKRINQLVARNAYNGKTHVSLAQVDAAFNAHRSPMIVPTNYRNPSSPEVFAPKYSGIGDSSREVKVEVGYRMEMITPCIGEIFRLITGKPEIVLWASAAKQKE